MEDPAFADFQATLRSLLRPLFNPHHARLIITRYRLLMQDINRGIVTAHGARHQAQILRREIINFRPGLLAQLTPDERNERTAAYHDQRAIINAMNFHFDDHEALIMYLAWWRETNDYILEEPEYDETTQDMNFWLAVAVVKKRGISVIDNLNIREFLFLQRAKTEIIIQLYAQMEDPAFGPDEDRGVVDFLLADDMDPPPASPGLLLPMDNATRIEAVLAVYVPISVDSLSPESRRCQICHSDYDEDHCRPCQATCCAPNTFCRSCLLQWYVDSLEETCPTCRKNWEDGFRAAILPASAA